MAVQRYLVLEAHATAAELDLLTGHVPRRMRVVSGRVGETAQPAAIGTNGVQLDITIGASEY